MKIKLRREKMERRYESFKVNKTIHFFPQKVCVFNKAVGVVYHERKVNFLFKFFLLLLSCPMNYECQ